MDLIWTESATKHLRKIFNLYLIKSESAAFKIHNTLVASVGSLKDFPEMAQKEQLLSKKKAIYRSLVVLKHFKIIYSVSQKNIYIIAIWDCRQHPQTNSSKIK